MRLTQPEALDLRSVLESTFEVRDEDPELFTAWMVQAFGEDDGWHDRKEGDEYVHHASTLSGCQRSYIFDRAGMEREPFSVESLGIFEIGRHFHVLVQMGLAVHPDYTLLGHEVGGVIEELNLAARADAVYEHNGVVYLIDVKTESPYAPKMRRKDAELDHRMHTARLEHVTQLSATAMVLRQLHPELAPDQAWVVYVTKDKWDVDQQAVTLMEDEAISRLHERDIIWGEYKDRRVVPDVLKDFPLGYCKPRSATDERGLYCPHRTTCVTAWRLDHPEEVA